MAFLKTADCEIIQDNIPANEALADIEVTNRFIKLAADLKKLAPRSDDFLYFSGILLHAAEFSLIDQTTGEYKKDKNGSAVTGGFDDKWKWACSDPSIEPYSNQNSDVFPEVELKKAYKLWQGKPLCINHESSNVEGVRGIIIDTHWDDKLKRVIGLFALDKKTYPDLAHKVKSGYSTNLSMGTGVSTAYCSVCQTPAITERDYCDHIRGQKGIKVGGITVREINVGLNPIELSIVVTPADPQAKILKVIASLNNYTDQKNKLLEEKSAQSLTQLERLDASVKTIEAQLSKLFVECSDTSCSFVKSSSGHYEVVKAAQEVPTWKRYLDVANELSKAEDPNVKQILYTKLDQMRPGLDIKTLKNDTGLLLQFADAMKSKDPVLHQNYLQKDLEALQAEPANDQPQFTSSKAPDTDTGLSGDSLVSVDNNGNETGRIQNPTPDKTMEVSTSANGKQLDTATNGFQFGNYANKTMAEGSKTIANIDEQLSLLLKQSHKIEEEAKQIQNKLNPLEEFNMNDARLRRRAEARRALLKTAATEECKEKDCEKKASCEGECDMCADHCACKDKKASVKTAAFYCSKCGDEVKDKAAGKLHAQLKHKDDGDVTFSDYKKSYWLGTEEPTPGKPQYAKDPLAGKARTEDKQMQVNPKTLGDDGLAPGDLEIKEKHLRAELEDRAMKRRAYWLGTEEPTPGKVQYPKDPLSEKARKDLDKQMNVNPKSLGGTEGMVPGDKEIKEKHLRASVLRSKFTKARNAAGQLDKAASHFEVFAGNQSILTATAGEIYGNELEANWDFIASPEYGKEVIAAIRKEGFDKVATQLLGPSFLVKKAQELPAEMPAAAPEAMPELPPAMDAGAAPADDKAAEVDTALSEIEERVSQLRDLTNAGSDSVNDIDINVEDKAPEGDAAAQDLGKSLTSALAPVAKEIYAELDQSADELALIYDSFSKSASLNSKQKEVLNKVAMEALADSKELIEEADVLISVAKKMEDEKEKKKPVAKKKNKTDDKKKLKKKKKASDMKELFMKLAQHFDGGDEGEDEDVMESLFDKLDEDGGENEDSEFAERKEELEGEDDSKFLEELEGLDEGIKELDADDTVSFAEDSGEACGMCGLAMDGAQMEHKCVANKEEQVIKAALADRKARREALAAKVVVAEEKKYDVTKDDHGHINDAHKGAEANPTTELDVKPTGNGARIEGLDEVKKEMMDAAESVATGKQGSVKEAAADPAAVKYYKEMYGDAEGGKEFATELTKDFIAKKAADEKAKERVRMRRAYDLAMSMSDKGLISNTKTAIDTQVDDIMKFSDDQFESIKRSVENMKTQVKTASKKTLIQVGVREDNSTPDTTGDVSLADALNTLGWK